jgi:hypothetical protein
MRVKGQLVADSAVQDFLGLVVCSPTDEKQRHFRRSHAFAMMYAAVWFRRICALQQCLALWYYTTRAGSKLVVVDDERSSGGMRKKPQTSSAAAAGTPLYGVLEVDMIASI